MAVRQKDYKRGGVYMIHLEGNTKGVQTGMRPCVVLTNEAGCAFSPVLTVIPLTTKRLGKLYPTQVPITPNDSNKLNGATTALCEQMTTVSKKDFAFYIGVLTEKEIKKIEDALLYNLGFKPLQLMQNT